MVWSLSGGKGLLEATEQTPETMVVCQSNRSQKRVYCRVTGFPLHKTSDIYWSELQGDSRRCGHSAGGNRQVQVNDIITDIGAGEYMSAPDDLLPQTCPAQSDPNLHMALGLLQEEAGGAKTRGWRHEDVRPRPEPPDHITDHIFKVWFHLNVKPPSIRSKKKTTKSIKTLNMSLIYFH